MSDEPKAPEKPAGEEPKAPKEGILTRCGRRLRGLGRFIKGVLYASPLFGYPLFLIPTVYDLGRAALKIRDEYIAKSKPEDALCNIGRHGGLTGVSGIATYLTRNPLYSALSGIYYGLTGLKDFIAPPGIDNPARDGSNYPKKLGYSGIR